MIVLYLKQNKGISFEVDDSSKAYQCDSVIEQMKRFFKGVLLFRRTLDIENLNLSSILRLSIQINQADLLGKFLRHHCANDYSQLFKYQTLLLPWIFREVRKKTRKRFNGLPVVSAALPYELQLRPSCLCEKRKFYNANTKT